jgi:hypothetical protein
MTTPTDGLASGDSPVPAKGIVFEVLRSGLIIAGLIGAAIFVSTLITLVRFITG